MHWQVLTEDIRDPAPNWVMTWNGHETSLSLSEPYRSIAAHAGYPTEIVL